MEAMKYEYTLRRAFQCGRGGAGGKADADIYRRYERAQSSLAIRKEQESKRQFYTDSRNTNDLEYEARRHTAIICSNLRDSISHVLNNKYPNNEQSGRLTQELLNLDNVSSEKDIVEVIDRLNELYKEMNLEVR